MILVTGATGITGAQVLHDLLRKGETVRALKRESSNLNTINKVFRRSDVDMANIEWLDCDITDRFLLDEAFQGIEQVYHCAAFISFDPEDREKIIDTNIHGTENIIDMCLKHHIKKLCYVSSIAAIGTCNNNMITEKDFPDTLKNKSIYSISKVQAELAVWAAIEEGLNAVIVNPGIILGCGNWISDSSSFVTFIKKGNKFFPPGKTGFIDVRDLSAIMIKLTNSEIKNERFIIVSENIKYKALFEHFAKELNVNPPNKRLNKFLAGAAWRLEKLTSLISRKKPRITQESIRASFNSCDYSNEKIRNTLGYEFLPINESVKYLVEQYHADIRSAY